MDWKKIVGPVYLICVNGKVTECESFDKFILSTRFNFIDHCITDRDVKTSMEMLYIRMDARMAMKDGSYRDVWRGDYYYETARGSHNLRDENHVIIPRWKIIERAMHLGTHIDPYRSHYLIRRNGYWYGNDPYLYNHDKNFRNGPVPGIRKGRRYCFFRHVRTNKERRDNVALMNDEDAQEYGVEPRGKRRGHNLPTAWDDICRQDFRTRSWKRHRKTQWKTK